MMSGAVAKGYGDVVVVVEEEDMMFDLLIGRQEREGMRNAQIVVDGMIECGVILCIDR